MTSMGARCLAAYSSNDMARNSISGYRSRAPAQPPGIPPRVAILCLHPFLRAVFHTDSHSLNGLTRRTSAATGNVGCVAATHEALTCGLFHPLGSGIEITLSLPLRL